MWVGCLSTPRVQWDLHSTNRTATLATVDSGLELATMTTGTSKNDDENFVTSLLTNNE